MALGIGRNDVRQRLAQEGAEWEVGPETAAARVAGFNPANRLGYVPGPDAPSLEHAERAARQLAAGPSAAAEAAAAPATFDWRAKAGKNYVTPVKDQGACGSCVAFGVLAAVESLVRISLRKPTASVNLSEAQLYFCYGPKYDAGACPEGGWWPDAALDALRAGVADESRYPYTDQNQKCRIPADWRTKSTRVTGWRQLGTPAAIKRHIAAVGPVTACFSVYEDFFYYGSGIYRHVTGELVGGHCVCVVGYNDAKRYWLCKNSWGTAWGEDGFVRIAYGQCGIDDGMWAADGVVVSTLRPWPVLKRGSDGHPARTLQYLLRFRGQQVGVDGDFGTRTETAVKAFQRGKALVSDGIVGPVTWAALITTLRRGSTGEAVKAVQEEVARHGTSLLVDGDFGARTEAAVKAYQRRVTQPADGKVRAPTWQALVSGMP